MEKAKYGRLNMVGQDTVGSKIVAMFAVVSVANGRRACRKQLLLRRSENFSSSRMYITFQYRPLPIVLCTVSKPTVLGLAMTL